jgi:isopentenyl diphosphate isomerase/L-lactate dehydrogenase-like FMN-dependent dehydrogenase
MVGKIVDSVAGKAAVLAGGSFRRGSDVAKALALVAPNLASLTRAMIKVHTR